MRFDRAELDALERRELQLTVLAAVLVLILSAGVALLMYPLVFLHPAAGNVWTPRIAYVGFCVLCLLFVGYLLDRHRTVRRLKQSLLEELDRNLKLRDQANVDLLHTIPDLNRFRDCLAMEFRRAVSTERALSLLLVKVQLTHHAPESNEGRMALGEAARTIARKLRLTDSVYLCGPGLFGVVLPETNSAPARQVSQRLEEVLRAVGATAEFSSEIFLYNYPDDVTSAHELDRVVAQLLPDNQPWPASTGNH
jgi:GGDEF domain-containing protein